MFSAIRYLVSDMDDTLLTPEKTVSPRSREALKALHDAGIGVVLASGRMLASMLPTVRELGLTLPLIACNGAQIAKQQPFEMIYEDLIPLQVLREVCRVLEETGCYFHLYHGDHFYYRPRGLFDQTYARETGITGFFVETPSSTFDTPVPKVLAIPPKGGADGLQDRLARRFAGRLYITRSSNEMVEITHHTATKGNALSHLLSLWGLPREAVVAIGDGRNDIPMFRAAGISVAMGSACAQVKAAATLQTASSEEDGFARFVLEQLLPQKERP